MEGGIRGWISFWGSTWIGCSRTYWCQSINSMARSNFTRRIPARFNFIWGIVGIPVNIRRGVKRGDSVDGRGIGIICWCWWIIVFHFNWWHVKGWDDGWGTFKMRMMRGHRWIKMVFVCAIILDIDWWCLNRFQKCQWMEWGKNWLLLMTGI